MILSFGKGWRKASGGVRILSGVLTICAVVGILYAYRDWKEARDFVPQDFNTFMEVPRSDREIENYTKFMQKAYREDTYGGDTPEETLKLFTDALRAGDTDLAAKYFVVEKQGEMVEELEIGKENGVLDLIISDISRIEISKRLDQNRHRFSTTKNNRIEFVYDFTLNKLTNKWKIESL